MINKIELIKDNIYYGKDDVYLQIIDKVYTFNDGQKSYTLRPFNKVDYSRKSLGNWNEWKSENEMFYGQGSPCVGGKLKSCSVKLVCDEKDHIISAEKIDSCNYKITLGLPGACKEDELSRLEKKEKHYPFK